MSPFDPLDLALGGALLLGAVGAAWLWRRQRAAVEAERAARRAAEADAQVWADAATLARRAKRDFVANISHEVRTPLNGILGMAGLLLDDGRLGPDDRRKVRTIRTSAQALLTLVNGVLDYADAEGGRLELERRDFAIQPLLESAVDLVLDEAREKGLPIVAYAEPTVARRLHGDAERIRQVTVSLLENAVKFTETGRVTLRAHAAGDGRLGIEVTDTGIGVDPAKVPELFQLFRRGSIPPDRPQGGTGLGLALSRRLVTLMDGEIGAEARPAGGSRFFFTVRTPEAVEQPKDALAGLSIGLVGSERETLLVAARARLRALGAEAEIVTADRASQPLILVDADRRGSSPADLLSGLREEGDPKLRAVLYQGWASRGAEQIDDRALSLPQPFREPLLVAAIEKLRAPSRAARSAPDRQALLSAGTEQDVKRQGRVLVVEDNEVNQRLALALLARHGLRADVAFSGAEAFEALARQVYDLVLMDCQMPVMDGLEATRRIRERERESGRHTPIAAVTASAMAGDRQRCLDAGMDDYLAKPVERQALAQVLARWLPAVVPRSLPAPPSAQMVARMSGMRPRLKSRAPSAPLDDDTRARMDKLAADLGPKPLIEILELFQVEAPRMLKRLRDALARGDGATLQRTAHTLAGSAGSIGALGLTDLCRHLEHAQGDAERSVLVEASEEELHGVLEAVQDEIERLGRAMAV